MIAGILEIQLMANMARLSDDMRRAEQVVTGSMTKVEKSVASAKTAMSQLGMGLSVGLLADTLRRTVDSYTKLDAQLRLSTKSQEQYNQALSDIREISTVAQSDISATTMLYTRLMNVMDGTGVSQEKLNLVTQTVSFGLKAYGATAQEAASASLQLSQAMGANRLGGEEFRAVMEAMPNVMKVLAKSMGVPLGELRALSIAGKITADEMVKAWGNPEIAAQFRKMAESAQTITGAWTVARNELMLLVGEFSKSSGVTGTLIAALKGVAEIIRITAKYVDDIAVAFGIWATITVSKMVVALVEARLAQVALNAAHAEALVMNVAMAQAARADTIAKLDNIVATRAIVIAEMQANIVRQEAAASELRLAESRQAAILAENTVRKAAYAAEVNDLAALGAARTAAHARIAEITASKTYMNGAAAESAIAAARAEIASLEAVSAATTVRMKAAAAALPTIEAETVATAQLTAATNALNAAELRLAETKVALAGLGKLQAKTNEEIALSQASVVAAQKLLDTSTVTTWGKIKGLVGRAGIWGMILWGVYELADAMGWVDKLFDKLDKRSSEQTFKSVGDINKAIAATEKQLAAQKELEKSRGSVGGALASAYDVSMGGSSADIEQRLKSLKLLREEEKKKLAAGFADAEERVAKERDVTGLIFETQKAAKAREIKELQDKTDKVLASRKFSDAQRLNLEEQYNAKLADINKKYADKDKVKRDEFLIDQTARLESILAVEKSVAQQEQEAWDKATTGKKVSYAALQEHLKVMDAARAADQIKRAGDTEKAIAEQSKALQAQRAESAGIRAETAGIAGQNALFGLTGDARIAAELEQAKQVEDLRYAADLEAQARRIQTMIDENTWKTDTATQQAVIMEDLERQHQERLIQIEKDAIEKKKSQQTGLLNFMTLIRAIDFKASKEKIAEDISGALKSGAAITAEFAQRSRTMFELNKAFSISSAIIDTLVAIGKIQREFPGPIGWAMGAVQAGLGALRVAAIANTPFGGGSASAAAGGAAAGGAAAGIPSMASTAPTVAPTAPTAMPTVTAPPREVNIYMRGDEVYGAKAVREQLIPALNDALGDGVVINVRAI